jgi:hypothetical protein
VVLWCLSGDGACLVLGPLWFWCWNLPAARGLVLEEACMVLEPVYYWGLSGAGGAFFTARACLLLEFVWCWWSPF